MCSAVTLCPAVTLCVLLSYVLYLFWGGKGSTVKVFYCSAGQGNLTPAAR